MSSVTYATGRLSTLTADEVAILAADIPLRALPPRRVKSPHPPPVRYSKRTSAHRAAERPPRQSRRFRRLNNEMHLVENAAYHGALPETPGEVKSLFQTQTNSEWTRLLKDSDKQAKWNAFMKLSEEQQTKLLQEERKQNMDGLKKVDGRVRALIKERPNVVEGWIRQVEERVDGKWGQVFVEGDPVQRLVARGVAQFHSLKCRGVERGEGREVVIWAKGGVGVRMADVVANA